MLIKIEAIVREEKFEAVKHALSEIGVNGLTVYQVMGCGTSKGYREVVRGMEIEVQMQPRSNLKSSSPPKSGSVKPSTRSRNQPLRGNPETARFSATKSAMRTAFAPKRPVTMPFRRTTNNENTAIFTG